MHRILATAGSGSSGFGGGGGGGGGSGFSGGSGGSSGGGDPLVGLILIGGFVLLLCWLFVANVRARRKRRHRTRRVELASAEAAADDEAFAAASVRQAATELFCAVQAAWSANDRDRLEQLVGHDLMVEWRRRLDDFAAKGWRNVVELREPPEVDYVGLVNREDDTDDRVVVHVEAKLNDYVVAGGGEHITRNGKSSESIVLYEYWTLGKRDDRWIVMSVEQAAEGDHHLEAEIVASPWADTERLRAKAVAERAAAEAAPPGVSPAELADLDFDGEARAAALDLALADGRFDPDLIEASVRRAVAAWTEAVDGPDAPLEAVARPSAVGELLHPHGDRSRLVVRGAEVRRVRIERLDAAARPPAVVAEIEVRGRRYVENRDTAAILEGSQQAAVTFTERWTLTLDGPAEWPWRIASALAHARS